MCLVKASGPKGWDFRHHWWRESLELFGARRVGYRDRSKETHEVFDKKKIGHVLR